MAIRTRTCVKAFLFLILVGVSFPQKSWGDQVDPVLIGRILGAESLTRADAATTKKQLDGIANSQTKLLDMDNKYWNVANPKWKVVYDRVRADLEADSPEILTAMTEAVGNLDRAYKAGIAENISQSDVDAILEFYGSPIGQRYRDFMRRIDPIMTGGTVSLFTGGAGAPGAALTPVQTQTYLRMLQMSHLFQMTVAMASGAQAAHQDTSGYGAIGFMAGAAINRSRAELEELSKQYADDIADFEAFGKGDASQHFFRAMGLSTQKMAKSANPAVEAIGAITKKHASEWKQLYQQ